MNGKGEWMEIINEEMNDIDGKDKSKEWVEKLKELNEWKWDEWINELKELINKQMNEWRE